MGEAGLAGAGPQSHGARFGGGVDSENSELAVGFVPVSTETFTPKGQLAPMARARAFDHAGGVMHRDHVGNQIMEKR